MATPIVLSIPSPAENESPYREFRVKGDPNLYYYVIQAGWNDGESKRRPRVFEVLSAIAHLQTSNDVANRVLYADFYQTDVDMNYHQLTAFNTGNIPATSEGFINFLPFGNIASGITAWNAKYGGIVELTHPHILMGGDMFKAIVQDSPVLTDYLTVMLRVKYLGEGRYNG